MNRYDPTLLLVQGRQDVMIFIEISCARVRVALDLNIKILLVDKI